MLTKPIPELSNERATGRLWTLAICARELIQFGAWTKWTLTKRCGRLSNLLSNITYFYGYVRLCVSDNLCLVLRRDLRASFLIRVRRWSLEIAQVRLSSDRNLWVIYSSSVLQSTQNRKQRASSCSYSRDLTRFLAWRNFDIWCSTRTWYAFCCTPRTFQSDSTIQFDASTTTLHQPQDACNYSASKSTAI